MKTTRSGRELEEAVEIIQQGGIVAYPTEAVYGLGCDPRQVAAIHRLLEIKERAIEKGFILIAAGFEQLQPYLCPVNETVMAKISATWPGPVTWLLPAADNVPRDVRGTHDTVAVRITAHPLTAKLCRTAGTALISTSANREGEPAARTAREVTGTFGSLVDFILIGDVGDEPNPTIIKDARTDEIVRPA